MVDAYIHLLNHLLLSIQGVSVKKSSEQENLGTLI